MKSFWISVRDRYLRAEANEMRTTVDSKGLLNLNIAVEQGGMIVLTPIESDILKTKSPATNAAGDF